MNIENYPDNWFVYDGMGDFYKEKGDTKKALEFYKKALTFSDQQETKAKIEKINNAK
jgi:predicted negative regulator of RcsB-dependent stress response